MAVPPFGHVPDRCGWVSDEFFQPFLLGVADGSPEDCTQAASFWPVGSTYVGCSDVASLVPPS